jgi:hypothetical protein
MDRAARIVAGEIENMSTSNKVLEQELTKFAIKNPTVSSEKIATLRAAYAQEKLPRVFMEAKRKLLEDAARAANYDYKIKECFVFPHPFQRFEFFLNDDGFISFFLCGSNASRALTINLWRASRAPIVPVTTGLSAMLCTTSG